MKVKKLVSIGLGLVFSIPPTFALFGSDLCRVTCNFAYCSKSQEQFNKCLYGCQHLNPLTPVMTMCLAGGKSAGFGIPSELEAKYSKKPEERGKESEKKESASISTAEAKKENPVEAKKDTSLEAGKKVEEGKTEVSKEIDPSKDVVSSIEELQKEMRLALEKREKFDFRKRGTDCKLFDDLVAKAQALFEKLKSPLDVHQKSLYMGEINGYVNSLKMILEYPKKKRQKKQKYGEAPNIEYTQMRKIQSAKSSHKREPQPVYDDNDFEKSYEQDRNANEMYPRHGRKRNGFDDEFSERNVPFK